MRQTESCFGIRLRFNLDAKYRRDFFTRTIPSGEAVIGGVGLKLFSTHAFGTQQFSRQRTINPAVLSQLVEDLLSGQVSYIALADRRTSPNQRPDEIPFSLEIGELPVRDGGFEQEVQVTGSRDLCDWEKLVGYLRNLLADFFCTYGNIMAATEFSRMLSQLTFVSISRPFVPGQPLQSDPAEFELGFYQRNEKELDKYVPKAYWGNVLSARHIEKLGGEERIRTESGCYLVERWGENLYLQATPSIWKVSEKTLRRLNSFLAPIRFPRAPEPYYFP